MSAGVSVVYIFASLQSSRKSHCLNVSLCDNTSSLSALVFNYWNEVLDYV